MTPVSLELEYAAPLDAAALRVHFARRLVPGVEAFDGARYVRSLRLPGGPGVVTLELADDARDPGPDGADHRVLRGELALSASGDLAAARARCRALLDLDGDPTAVRAALGADPLLGRAVRASPGRRVPGAADTTEQCVRAILGQQISLAGAASAAGRLVARCGEPLPSELVRGAVTHEFPSAAALAALPPQTLAMPRARGRSVVALAAALAADELAGLRRGGDATVVRPALLALPGIGPWTADYVIMRVLGDHDVFLAGDLGVRRALERAGLPADPRAAAALAERWRPYRSYALHHLWAL